MNFRARRAGGSVLDGMQIGSIISRRAVRTGGYSVGWLLLPPKKSSRNKALLQLAAETVSAFAAVGVVTTVGAPHSVGSGVDWVG